MPNEMQKLFKSYLALSGMTLSKVVEAYNAQGHSTNISNINNKLARESIRYTEIVKLADIMGYNIVWEKK